MCASDLLRAFERRHGLTSEELAVLLGIETAVVRRYEYGEAPDWMEYALLGLEYHVSGTLPDARNGTDWYPLTASRRGAPSVPSHAGTDARTAGIAQ